MNLEVLVRCYADSLAWNDEDQKLRSLERLLRTLSDDVANLAEETEGGRLGSSAKLANHDAIADAMDADDASEPMEGPQPIDWPPLDTTGG